MERRKIHPSVRRQENLLRQQALQASLHFEKRLTQQRTKLVNKIARELKEYPQSEWEQFIAYSVQEPYLQQWYRDMYMQIGSMSGERAVRNFLRIKTDMNTWEKALYDWIGENMGNKITLVSGTLKEWVVNTVMQYMDENPNIGVEKLTEGVERAIRSKWKDARGWQIRRIVQTESLTALSEAADVAIKSLNIRYNKTWGISGHNTRRAHLAMNGVTISERALFNVDGELLEFPRDTLHGASAGNIVNCACFCIRTPIGDSGDMVTDFDILNMV